MQDLINQIIETGSETSPVLTVGVEVEPSVRYFSAKTGGFYDSNLHRDMPNDVVAVDAETYEGLLAAQGDGKVIRAGEGGIPVAVDRASLLTPQERLTAAKETARDTLVAAHETRLKVFTNRIPNVEVHSWTKKELTARAHLAGTPQQMIIDEALVTGEEPSVLAARIVYLADIYTSASATASGIRRAAVWQIDAASTTDEVEAALAAAVAAFGAIKTDP